MYVFTTLINVLTIQNKKNKEKIINGTGFLIEKKRYLEHSVNVRNMSYNINHFFVLL